jgi:intracellular multiplication protein IcmC
VNAHAQNYDFLDWLNNIAKELPALRKLVVAVSYLAGIGCFVSAVMKLKSYAQNVSMMSSQKSLLEPMVYLTMSGILIYYAGFIDASSTTIFGADWADKATGVVLGGGDWDAYLRPIIEIVRLIGYIAFLKGVFLLKNFGQQSQQGGIGKAITFMLGGILAINFESTWNMLYRTLVG